MNPSYNIVAAAERLEALALERSTENLVGIQLAEWDGNDGSDVVQVVDEGPCSTKRLIWRQDDASEGYDHQRESNEVIWHVQGALTLVDLPPFVPKGRYRDKVKFLRQGVRISGLDTPSFDRALQSVKDVLTVFSRSVAKIQSPTFLGEDEQGFYLDTSNRYFSSTRDGRGGIQKQFDTNIDPTGALALLGGGDYYHGEENTVLYLESRVGRLTGKKIVSPVPPVAFKAGDLIEAQVTFMLVPVRGEEWKLVATLRCVVLLDSKFTQDCIRRNLEIGIRSRDNRRSTYHPKGLKRRAGHDIDEEAVDVVPILKMARMDLDADGN